MNKLVEKLNQIKQLENELQKKRSTFEQKLENEGYFLNKNGEIEKLDAVLGLFWDLSFTVDYLRDRQPYIKDVKGAVRLSKEEAERIKTCFKNKKHKEASLSLEKLLNLRKEEDDKTFQKMLIKGGVQEVNGLWKWISFGRGKIDQMRPGSNIVIRETTLKEIESIEHKEYDMLFY